MYREKERGGNEEISTQRVRMIVMHLWDLIGNGWEERIAVEWSGKERIKQSRVGLDRILYSMEERIIRRAKEEENDSNAPMRGKEGRKEGRMEGRMEGRKGQRKEGWKAASKSAGNIKYFIIILTLIRGLRVFQLQ